MKINRKKNLMMELKKSRLKLLKKKNNQKRFKMRRKLRKK